MKTSAKGMVLEDWCYNLLYAAGFECMQNIGIENKNGKCQIDVIFRYRGAVYLVECKVRQLVLITKRNDIIGKWREEMARKEEIFRYSSMYRKGERVVKWVVLDGGLSDGSNPLIPFYNLCDLEVMKKLYFSQRIKEFHNST